MQLAKNLDCIVEYVAGNYGDSITIDDLERVAGISRFAISRQFQRVFHLSPMRWVWRFRVSQAASALARHPALSCRDVAHLCGFETPSHFSRQFRKVIGCPPGHYRASLKTE